MVMPSGFALIYRILFIYILFALAAGYITVSGRWTLTREYTSYICSFSIP